MNYVPENLRRWTMPGSYVGATWEGYYAAPVGRSRESSCLEESNWIAQWKALKPTAVKEATTDPSMSPFAIRESHWAVGWVEWIAIHETNEEALRTADELAEGLDGYPVLDETDWSEREQEEANKVWRDMSGWQRTQFYREHRSQFDFHGFADMLGCLRGHYFAGQASDLIGG